MISKLDALQVKEVRGNMNREPAKKDQEESPLYLERAEQELCARSLPPLSIPRHVRCTQRGRIALISHICSCDAMAVEFDDKRRARATQGEAKAPSTLLDQTNVPVHERERECVRECECECVCVCVCAGRSRQRANTSETAISTLRTVECCGQTSNLQGRVWRSQTAPGVEKHRWEGRKGDGQHTDTDTDTHTHTQKRAGIGNGCESMRSCAAVQIKGEGGGKRGGS